MCLHVQSCKLVHMSVRLLYYKIKNVYFVCLFFIYLCEKYYKPVIVQFYVANCVSCVCRLTLLDL